MTNGGLLNMNYQGNLNNSGNICYHPKSYPKSDQRKEEKLYYILLQ